MLTISDGKKTYILGQLKDLQSKLSLVVGKVQHGSEDGKEQMEYFTQVRFKG